MNDLESLAQAGTTDDFANQVVHRACGPNRVEEQSHRPTRKRRVSCLPSAMQASSGSRLTSRDGGKCPAPHNRAARKGKRDCLNYRHCPVSVKAAQKYGFEKSGDRSNDNCACRHASPRGSPACQRRMNSVISRAVARSFTFQ